MSDDVDALKRSEYIADIVTDTKPVIVGILMGLWEDIHKNSSIPKRHWLQKFQLALKNIATYDDDKLFKYLHQNGGKRRYLLDNLYEVYVLTAMIYHDDMTLRLKKDNGLVATFLRQTALQSARELWYKPETMFNITHKKELVVEARDVLEKTVIGAIKFTLRSQVKELIATQEDIIEKQTPYIDVDHDRRSEYSSDVSSTSSYGLDAHMETASTVKEVAIGASDSLEHFVDERKVIQDVARSHHTTPRVSRQPSSSSIGSSHKEPPPIYGYVEGKVQSRNPSPERQLSRTSSVRSESDELRRSFEEKFMVTLDNSNHIVPFENGDKKDTLHYNDPVEIDDMPESPSYERIEHHHPTPMAPPPSHCHTPKPSSSPAPSEKSIKHINLNLSPTTEKYFKLKEKEPERVEKEIREKSHVVKEKKRKLKTSLDTYRDYYNGNTSLGKSSEFSKGKYFYKG